MAAGSDPAETKVEPLQFDYHGFLTNSYLIHSRGKMVLVDTGSAVAAREVIMPHLSDAGFESLAAIVETHSHADHSGGTALLGRNTGRPAMVHRKEAKWIVDRRLAFSEWFDTRRLEVPVTGFMQSEFLADAGEGFADLISVDGGEAIEVASIQLIETPGHSPGSLSVFAEEGRYLFTGDSVQGEGTAPYQSTIPLYDDYMAYRNSLLKLDKVKADGLMTAHPLKPLGKAKFVGDEVKELISSSLDAADRLHSDVRRITLDHKDGIGTLEIAQEVASVHGSTWLQPVGTFFVRTVAAHLNQLEAEGALVRDRQTYFAKS